MGIVNVMGRSDSQLLSPAERLSLGLLERAKRDAVSGDLAALAWLVYAGADIAEALSPGGRGAVIAWCDGVLEDIDRQEVAQCWRLN